MNITNDDPRLTAYVLNELDEVERGTVESEIRNFDECRLEIEEIAWLTNHLKAELAVEPMPALAPSQQRAIEARVRQIRSKPKLSWIPSGENWLLKTELAAAIAMALWVVPLPAVVTNPAMKFIATASTDTACALVQMAGIPVFKHGLWLTFPSGRAMTFFWDGDCRPIYSSLMLLLTAIMAGNLYLRSRLKRLCLVVSALPLAILKEVFRYLAFVALWTRTKADAHEFPMLLHKELISFGLSLILLVFVLTKLRRLEAKNL